MKIDKHVEQTLLYDFYGELLTKRQKSIYEDVIFNDMSITEAAMEWNISRQGIHDCIHKVNQQLVQYEEKLGLLERFMKIQKLVLKIEEKALDLELTSQQQAIQEIIHCCCQIKEEL